MKHTKILTVAMLAALAITTSMCKAQAKGETAPGEVFVEENEAVATAENASVRTPESDAQYRPDMTVSEPTIIDFNAVWCGPCRLFAPSFEMASATYKGKMNFVAIDVDAYPATAQAFGIQSIPTVCILMPDGKTYKYVGLNDFVAGSSVTSASSQAEIDAAIYKGLCKIIDSKLKK